MYYCVLDIFMYAALCHSPVQVTTQQLSTALAPILVTLVLQQQIDTGPEAFQGSD